MCKGWAPTLLGMLKALVRACLMALYIRVRVDTTVDSCIRTRLLLALIGTCSSSGRERQDERKR